MDVTVLQEYLPIFAEAFLLTVRIGLAGVALAFVIGVAGAFILYFKIPVFSVIIKCYVELFRNTPLLVQLFFIYYERS